MAAVQSATLDRIHHVAEKVIKTKQQGHDVVVVVSAMYGETDRFIQLANALTNILIHVNMMYLISTGEQVSMALLSMALNAKTALPVLLPGHKLASTLTMYIPKPEF